ncbi:MAG: phage/plasmid primase, P4 family [Methanothrix soehngenii]|nr:phage/plasmid primase, P4 family [Methanothrix soehngenii]
MINNDAIKVDKASDSDLHNNPTGVKGYDFTPKWPLASDKRTWLGQLKLDSIIEIYENFHWFENLVIDTNLNVFYDAGEQCSGGPLELIGNCEGLGSLGELCNTDSLLSVLPEVMQAINIVNNKIYAKARKYSGSCDEAGRKHRLELLGAAVSLPRSPVEVLRGMQLVKSVLETNELYVYRGVWQPISDSEVAKFLDALGEPDPVLRIRDMKKDSKFTFSLTRLYPGKEESTQNYHLVDRAGKVLDLREAMKDAHYDVEHVFKPDLYLTNRIAARYDRRVSSRAINDFLEDVVANPEKDVPLLQEWLGYNLLAKQFPIHRALMLIGPGRGGRSTFFESLERMLGSWNVSHVPLQRLGERFGLVNLIGKMANITPDIDSMPIQGTGKFKSISGGDTMDVERKGLPDIEGAFLPVKLSLGCNQVPHTPDKTIAFYERSMIIELPYQFFDKPEEAEDPARAKKRVARKVDELVSHQVSGLLNYAIEGLGQLLDRGSFDYLYTDAANRERYERFAAPENEVEEFVSECCITEPARSPVALWTGKTEVYEAYRVWCSRKDVPVRPMSLTALTRGLRVLNFPDGKGQRDYRGIALKPS